MLFKGNGDAGNPVDRTMIHQGRQQMGSKSRSAVSRAQPEGGERGSSRDAWTMASHDDLLVKK